MLVDKKCHCEFEYGFGNKSGILCERNGTFENALLCGLSSFCTGPFIEQEAVNGTNTLCKQGKSTIFIIELCHIMLNIIHIFI